MLYLLASLFSLYLIPVITAVLGETNLPPLKGDVRWAINLLYVNLAAAYYLFCRGYRDDRRMEKWVWAALAFLALALCASPPVFSGDLNEYLLRGRIFAVHHANPYLHPPAEFPNDLLYPYTSWWNAPHTYGPVLAYAQAIPVLLFPDSIVGMVTVMKLVFFAFLLGTFAAFDRLLDAVNAPNRRLLFFAFVFNPLFIVSTLVDGHNDVVMLFFTVLAAVHLMRKQYTRCFVYWTLAFLVKYTVGLLLPFWVVLAIRDQWAKGPVRVARFIALQAGLSLLIMFALFAPFWRGLRTFGVIIDVSQWFYSNTVPYMAHQLLALLQMPVSTAAVKYAFLGLFAAGYSALLVKTATMKLTATTPLFRIFSLAYVLFFCTITSPLVSHYLLWALPWLLLSAMPLPNFFVTLYSFTALFFYFKRPNYLMALAAALYLAALLWDRMRGGAGGLTAARRRSG